MTDINKCEPRPDRNPARMKKTLQQAQTSAFTTQLFYFAMKILFSYILFKYHNCLSDSWPKIISYILLLIINSYLILSIGKDPGYEPSTSSIINQQQQINQLIQNTNNYCDICHCKKKIRTKHCFKCGKCVRKYDHHCPWIGACVGESNHLIFCLMTLLQTIQAVVCFWICFDSMRMYEYKQGNEGYSQEFGVFAIFSFFMFLYILFVASLFFFHSYLIFTNYTTTELTQRSKAVYLRGIKGNPFSRGIFTNIYLTWNIPQTGQQKINPYHSEWIILQSDNLTKQRTWIQKVWSNQYYDCC